jgi:signal transduction histidine kinase
MNQTPQEPLDIAMLAHELRNTLAATDMFLERAEEYEQLGTDPVADIKAARKGVAETLEIIARRLEA